MKNLFKENLAYLKEEFNETYANIGLKADVSANTVTNWIDKNNEPKISQLEKIAQYFEISVQDLLFTDLKNVNLNRRDGNGKNTKNVNLNVNPSVNLNPKKGKELGHLDQAKSMVDDHNQEYKNASKVIDALTIAVKGLERANARLEQEIEEIREENTRLKSEIPVIGKGLESKKARAS